MRSTRRDENGSDSKQKHFRLSQLLFPLQFGGNAIVLCVAISAGACWAWRNGSIGAFGNSMACGAVSSQDLGVCDLGRPDCRKFREHVLVRASLTSAELLVGKSRGV